MIGDARSCALRRSRFPPFFLPRSRAANPRRGWRAGPRHRDLKPANIFLLEQSGPKEQPDFVKILDFGIAKQAERSAAAAAAAPEPTTPDSGRTPRALPAMTSVGAVMGTPPYMPPEQARGESAGPAADQYSLGCILYEMLCGGVPFTALTLRELLRLHIEAPPPPLRQAPTAGRVPPALELLVQRLLAKTPTARFASLQALEDALHAVLKDLDRAAAPVVRGPWLLWITLTVTCVAVAIGVRQNLRARSTAERRPPPPAELRALRGQALAVLRQDLRAEPPLRHAAITALGQLHAFEATAELRALLADPDANARRLAARALVLLGEPRGRQQLEAELQSQDPAAQLQASYLLCDQDSAAAKAKLSAALLQEQIPADLLLDVLACLSLDGQAAVARPRLVSQFHAAAQPQARIPVAARLARLGDEEARRYLRELAQRRGPAQLAAARALAAPEESELAPLFRGLIDSPHAEAPARLLASEGLGYCGDLSDTQVLAPLMAGGAPALAVPPLRQAAASAVLRLFQQDPASLSDQSFSWAVAALSDAGWATRAAAVGVLGESRAEQAQRLVAGLLHDPDSRVRGDAVRALARHPGAAAVRLLRDSLRDDDAEVRVATVRALRRLLGELLADDLGRVRSDVQAWLGELLTDTSPQVELAARQLLFWLGDRAQEARLRAFALSPDAALRRALSEQAELTDPALLAGLRDGDFAVRFAAARRLAAAGQAQARAVLAEALARGGAEGIVAYGLLRRIGATPVSGAQALARFRGLLDAEQPLTTRLWAVEAAAELPVAEALALLQPAVHDPEPQVRRRVAEVTADLLGAGGSADGRSAGVIALRTLSLDENAAVRARAASLLSRGYEPSQLHAGPAKEAAPPSSPPIDGGAPPDASPPADAAPPERAATEPDSAAEIERAFAAGSQAGRQGNSARAVRLLSRARLLCGQSAAASASCTRLGSQIALALARVYEHDKQLPDAMREYQRATAASGAARLPAAQRAEAQRATVRLSLALGRVIIRSRQHGACRDEVEWLPAGVKSYVTVDQRTVPVQVGAGETKQLGECP